jgi:hypothetical protein
VEAYSIPLKGSTIYLLTHREETRFMEGWKGNLDGKYYSASGTDNDKNSDAMNRKISPQSMFYVIGHKYDKYPAGKGNLSTDLGVINLSSLIGTNPGDTVASHLGHEFSVYFPRSTDFLPMLLGAEPQCYRKISA